ncbi:hypothetical protein H2202_010842 [Exophiala xenobiotica]|nr:hypothetical protein H2202_010842 [Exophiala xenobiotica]
MIDWEPDNIIASLWGGAERGPLLQRKDSTEQTLLYEFKLAEDNVLAISTRDEEVEATWYELAERYKLQRGKVKDFKLTDIFCLLQADDKIITSIPPEEVAALKECVRILATHAVKRLELPTFSPLRDRTPVFQCELHIFTLCLRKESKEQSVVLIQSWLGRPLYAWIYGHMFQVMTTKTQTAVEVFITYERDGKLMTLPKYEFVKTCQGSMRNESDSAVKVLGMPGKFSRFQERRHHHFANRHTFHDHYPILLEMYVHSVQLNACSRV